MLLSTSWHFKRFGFIIPCYGIALSVGIAIASALAFIWSAETSYRL
jgi:hypothetical protein